MYREDDLSALPLLYGKNARWNLISTRLADDRGSATTKGASA
jgi:hypothetical protein